jgi:hypothetical protein
MGEGPGGGGQKQLGPDLVPLPFIPSHGGEGSFYWSFLQSVRDKFSDFLRKNLYIIKGGAIPYLSLF